MAFLYPDQRTEGHAAEPILARQPVIDRHIDNLLLSVKPSRPDPVPAAETEEDGADHASWLDRRIDHRNEYADGTCDAGERDGKIRTELSLRNMQPRAVRSSPHGS
jgi:hypothetical protein